MPVPSSTTPGPGPAAARLDEGCCRGRDGSRPERAVSPAAPRAAGETVLVAEDTPELRRMAVRILESLGYRVLEAADGDEALAILRAGIDRVDLVLADVVMPRLGGVELFELARAHDPRLVFLFTSGCAEEDVGSVIPRQPGVGAIPKPYRLAVLARRIRELLDERP